MTEQRRDEIEAQVREAYAGRTPTIDDISASLKELRVLLLAEEADDPEISYSAYPSDLQAEM